MRSALRPLHAASAALRPFDAATLARCTRGALLLGASSGGLSLAPSGPTGLELALFIAASTFRHDVSLPSSVMRVWAPRVGPCPPG